MIHDLIAFPGARISLTAINAVVDSVDDDGKPTVSIHYGPYNAGLSFEGTGDDVMKLIDDWVAAQHG